MDVDGGNGYTNDRGNGVGSRYGLPPTSCGLLAGGGFDDWNGWRILPDQTGEVITGGKIGQV